MCKISLGFSPKLGENCQRKFCIVSIQKCHEMSNTKLGVDISWCYGIPEHFLQWSQIFPSDQCDCHSVFPFLFSIFSFLFSVFCSLQISVIVTQCRVLSTSTTGQVLWASGNSISSGQKTSADCSTIRKICLFSNCQISFQGTESDARWRISQWPTRTDVGRSDTRLFFSSWEKPDGQIVGNLFAVGIGEIESQDTLF